MDDLPFRLALERAEAQVGTVRNDLIALKAKYGDMETQIKQAQYDIEYYDREFHRQQDLAFQERRVQPNFDTARRNFQNAQQKLASLNQQLVALPPTSTATPASRSSSTRATRCRGTADEAARQLDHPS